MRVVCVTLFGLAMLLGNVYAAIDPSFCNIDTILAIDDMQPPKGDINAVFKTNIEINENGKTVEIEELYDGPNNRGVSASIQPDDREIVYAFLDTDELLIVGLFSEGSGLPAQCTAMKFSESIGKNLSPFYHVIVDNRDHIATPEMYMTTFSNTKFKHTANTMIQGIPTWQFVACFYDDNKKESVKLTYSYMDTVNWNSDITVNSSVPLQALYERKPDGSSLVNTMTVSYSEYKPNLWGAKNDFATPTGVFCVDRQPGKAIPDINNRFSFMMQSITPFSTAFLKPIPGGLMTYAKEELEIEAKLFRFTTNKLETSDRVVEIHDFNTGLNYVVNKNTGTCNITTIDQNGIDAYFDGEFIQIRNQSQFFDFNSAEVQYIGQKVIDNVLCDLWAGREKFLGLDSTFEWRFLANGWVDKEQLRESTNGLVSIMITQNVPDKDTPGKFIQTSRTLYFNEFSSHVNLMDYDISECEDKLPKKDLYFQMTGSKGDVLLFQSHDYQFRRAITKTLLETMKVDFMRISKIQPIDVSINGTIFVLFTLYEKPTFYGKVKRPATPDLTSDEALKLINDQLKSKDIVVEFVDDNGFTEMFKIVSTELRSFDRNSGGYIYLVNEIRQNPDGYSTGTFFLMALGAVVLGLLLGLVIGFFLIVKRSSSQINRIVDTRLSFINPSFNETTQSYKKHVDDA